MKKIKIDYMDCWKPDHSANVAPLLIERIRSLIQKGERDFEEITSEEKNIVMFKSLCKREKPLRGFFNSSSNDYLIEETFTNIYPVDIIYFAIDLTTNKIRAVTRDGSGGYRILAKRLADIDMGFLLIPCLETDINIEYELSEFAAIRSIEVAFNVESEDASDEFRRSYTKSMIDIDDSLSCKKYVGQLTAGKNKNLDKNVALSIIEDSYNLLSNTKLVVKGKNHFNKTISKDLKNEKIVDNIEVDKDTLSEQIIIETLLNSNKFTG